MNTLSLAAAVAAALLFAVWIAYPILIGILASSGDRASAPGARLAPVSVILISRESPDVIRAKVANLLASDYPHDLLEIVVGLDSQGSNSSVTDLQFTDPRVRVLQGDAPGGKAATLNAAVRSASGAALVFADSYQTFAPDAVRLLVAALQVPDVAAVSGRLDLAPAADPLSPIHMYWAYETWLRACEARWHSSVGVFGPIWAMRREWWEPLPAGLILDDVYTPMRLVLAGQRVDFESRAVALEKRVARPDSEYRRKVRTLTGNIQLCSWLSAILIPWRNPIWVQFICHKVGRLITPYALTVLVLAGALPLAHAISNLPLAARATLLATAGTVVVVRSLRRPLTRLGAWLVGIQAAVVVATLNGVQGRWDVWER